MSPVRAFASCFVLLSGTIVHAGDFNGDGFADLVISATGVWHDGIESSGSIFVVPGSASGPLAAATIEIDSLDLGTAYQQYLSFGRQTA